MPAAVEAVTNKVVVAVEDLALAEAVAKTEVVDQLQPTAVAVAVAPGELTVVVEAPVVREW
jgi:hypothetical protein